MDESTYNTLRLIVYIVGVPIIVALLVSIVRKVRAIKVRIQEVREEAERNAKDPYAQMAELYAQDEARKTLQRARRGKV